MFATLLLLAGCGQSQAPQMQTENSPPPMGEARAGTVYWVTIDAPDDGEPIAFTVFEPAQLAPGAGYPLVLHGHGFGNSRALALNPVSPGDIDALVAAGYGVISVDQRGHGDSGGLIRIMDPDYEGTLLLAVLDWAEANLDWLAYAATASGERNLVLGSIGTSYGGMAQLMLQAIDPQQRLDAMLVQNAPYDLRRGLFPNGVYKTSWNAFFRLVGEGAGNTSKGNLDPFVRDYFVGALGPGTPDAFVDDFFRYHSHAYFCEGEPVASNGGAGTQPQYPPRLPAQPLHALLFQGPRDTLFPLNEAMDNAACLRRRGGDVRLYSYQSGHNTLPAVLDPGVIDDPTAPFETRCGSLTPRTALLAFFDHHLRGNADASAALPTQACVSLASGDAVLLDEIPRGKQGSAHSIDYTGALDGLPDLPLALPLDVEVPASGALLAGLPHAALQIDTQAPDGAPALLLFGLGLQRGGTPLWTLIDNQLLPWRGSGNLDQAFNGVGERLAPGDRLALLIYSAHDQYSLSGGGPAQVSISGQLWLPLLAGAPAAP